MPSFDFDSYLAQAQDELEQKQAQLGAEHGIGTYNRFVVDYVAGSLDFFQQEAPKLQTLIIPVATHVPEKKSLKWAWANDQYPPEVREAASKTKELTELTGFEIFQDEYVECDEAMAWEITALACKFLGAKGAYRVPHGHIYSYVLIAEIKSAA